MHDTKNQPRRNGDVNRKGGLLRWCQIRGSARRWRAVFGGPPKIVQPILPPMLPGECAERWFGRAAQTGTRASCAPRSGIRVHGAPTRSNGGRFLNKFCFGSFDRQDFPLPASLTDEHNGHFAGLPIHLRDQPQLIRTALQPSDIKLPNRHTAIWPAPKPFGQPFPACRAGSRICGECGGRGRGFGLGRFRAMSSQS